jgi:PAS domain S-box-containing protein
MPEMNGYELCKKIKSNKNTEDIPVILLTQLSDAEEIIEGLSCGADSFITKPFNEDHLLSIITRFISDENHLNHGKVPFGVQIFYKGEKRLIQAEQQNVIKLVLSIYEAAIQQNEKLIQTQEELRSLNERLESLVEDRTADLTAEIKLSNQLTTRLKESEEIFQHFLYNSPVYIFFKDQDIRSKMLSKNFEQMIGRPINEIIGKTMDDLFPSDLAKKMIADDKIILSERKTIVVDEELNGRYYNTIKFPIIINGQPLYLAGFTTDITERILAVEELKNKLDELQRFHNLTVGRELTMIELKKEVNELLRQSGEKEKYVIVK